jgi:hypothetical protein
VAGRVSLLVFSAFASLVICVGRRKVSLPEIGEPGGFVAADRVLVDADHLRAEVVVVLAQPSGESAGVERFAAKVSPR